MLLVYLLDRVVKVAEDLRFGLFGHYSGAGQFIGILAIAQEFAV